MKYWLWLSTASRVSPRAKSALLSHYGSPEALFGAPKGEITRLLGKNTEGIDELERRDLKSALNVIDQCEAQGIGIVTIQDADYPDRLRSVFSPPLVLYVKGSLPALDEECAIAVIGTRKATPYGIKMGRKLGSELARCGAIVVSGLTQGIDAEGALGALTAGGKVIGVLGTAHEYAKSALAKDTAASGALVSEYPPGAEPNRAFFRARNRISSGLSVGVVVVEAPEKSGTRLFVTEAAEQGREIFAVPGNADAYNCAGTNAMLKEGAKPVTDGWEIACEFAALFPGKLSRPEPASKPAPGIDRETEEPVKKQKTGSNGKKVIDKPETSGYIDLQKQLEGLTDTQLKIVSVMETPSMHIDDIILSSALAPARVLADLTLLQLKGCVSQESGKRFTLNIKAK